MVDRPVAKVFHLQSHQHVRNHPRWIADMELWGGVRRSNRGWNRVRHLSGLAARSPADLRRPRNISLTLTPRACGLSRGEEEMLCRP